MEQQILALVENTGFLDRGVPNEVAVRQATAEDIIFFCEQLSVLSEMSNPNEQATIFSHCASLPLSGGKVPCRKLECRLGQVASLAQFAAFYSDRVYVQNIFYDYLHQAGSRTSQIEILREEFIRDLTVFAAYLPFIEARLIVPVTFADICPHCLAVTSIKGASDATFKKTYDSLVRRYLSEVSYHIERRGKKYRLVATGPDILLPHGSSVWQINAKSVANRLPEAISSLTSRAKVKLSSEQAEKIGAPVALAEAVIQSVSYEVGAAHCLRTSYLSESELEIELLQTLTEDPVLQRKSAMMKKHMSFMVPFIDGLSPDLVMKLREEEHEAFVLFRRALTQAIDEYDVGSRTFSERDAQAIYADIVEPHLATLDSKVRSAKRLLAKGFRRKLTGWAGAMTLGLYAGISMSSVIAGAAAFGAGKVISEIIEDVMARSDAEEVARDDAMYFLWKARSLLRNND